MLRRNRAAALVLFASCTLAGPAAARDEGYPAAALLSTGTSIIGETLSYPTTGPAHVTAAIVTLAPGASTIVHKHGVPLFAYILEGELTVDYGEHGKRTYRQGQAFMEAMAAAHAGTNTGSQPVRLLGGLHGRAGLRGCHPRQIAGGGAAPRLTDNRRASRCARGV